MTLRFTLLSAALITTLAAGCGGGPQFCETSDDCSGSTPFCDIKGEFPASKGIGKTCIPDPNVGSVDAGVAADASTIDGTPPDAPPADAMEVDAALPADLVAAPTSNDFGDVTEGNMSASVSILFRNDGGTATLALGTILSDTANFEITVDGCATVSLAPAESCTVEVRFTPATTGTQSATLSVSDGADAAADVLLDGNGLALGDIGITPTAPTFGSVAVGSQSPAQSFVVRNNGGSPTGTLATTLGDATNYAFVVDNCAGQVLNASQSCSVEVRFTPTIAGSLNGTLSVSASPGGTGLASLSGTGTARLTAVTDGGGTGSVSSTPIGINCPGTCAATFNTATVRLTAAADMGSTFTGWSGGGCTGVTACDVAMTAARTVTATFERNPSISMTPATAALGTTNVGSASTVQTFTVRNSGDLPTGAITTNLTNTTNFTMDADNCAGQVLGGGQSCTIDVSLTPATVGALTATLSVSATAGGSDSSALSGTGSAVLTVITAGNGAGSVTSSPTGINCPGGSCSATYTSTAPVQLTATGAAGSTFAGWSGGGCSGTGACSVAMTASRSVTATFNTIGDLGITPGAPSFGSVNVGAQSGTQIFTVTNSGGSATGVIASSLGDQANYGLGVDNCAGQSLSAGQTCTVEVRFTPTVAGAHGTSLVVSATPGGTASASLAGTGSAALAVTLAGNGSGSVASSPAGISCPAGNCSATFSATPVRLTASAAAGSNFAGWSGGGCSGTGVCNVSMTAARNVTATFNTNALLALTPASNAFGNVSVSGQSASQTFTLTNNGGTASGAISTTLTDLVNFTVVADNCDGQVLGAGQTCTIQVRFTPAAVGAHSATLSATATPGGSDSTSLSGTGTAVLTVATAGNGSGSVTSTPAGISCPGSCSSTYSETPIRLTASAASGSTFAGWSGGGCSGTGICNVAMTGAQSVTANFNTNGALEITPASPNFGSTGLGSQSATQTFTVANTGGSATGLIATTLVDLTNYELIADNCVGQSLGAGQTCTIQVRFAPAAVGVQGTTLTVAATPGGSDAAALSGTGTAVLTVTTNGAGTVTSNPAGINCPGTCSAAFSTTPVQLTASSGSTTTFTAWSGSGCSGTGVCSVAMTGARSVGATFTINNISIGDAIQREGHYGNTIFSFPVDVNPAPDHPVTVNYTTVGGSGTATPNSDYLTTTDSIVFNVGETSKTIDIVVFPDKISELDETFTLTLSSATGAVLPATRTATGTIVDDDGGLDLNSDGFADLAIGAYKGNQGGGAESGAAYVYFGKQTPSSVLTAGAANTTFVGEDPGDWFGLDVTGGDVNGDGFDDLIVCARNDDDGGTDAGAVYVFFGPLANGVIDASTADVKIKGTNASDHFGIRIAAADVNADGISDILVGARDDDDGGSNSGTAFIFYGSSSLPATIDASTAAAKLVGVDASDGFGFAIANAGDLNSDGLEDVLVGAFNASNGSVDAGAAYVFYGSATWSLTTIDASNADIKFAGTINNQDVGYSVSGDVDANGDGRDDIIISERTTNGAAYIFFGRDFSPGQVLSTANADFSFFGAGSGLGYTVDGIGDVNGDSIGDFVVGAPDADQVASNAGRAYVILGSPTLSGTATETSPSVLPIRGPLTTNTHFGGYSSVKLDFNRDGVHDFMVGLKGEVVTNAVGIAYLFIGSNTGNFATTAASLIAGSTNGDGFGVGLQ